MLLWATARRARRCIEVLANGPPLARRPAVVSPVTQPGGAQPNADRIPGAALEQAAKRKRLQAYTEFAVVRRYRLVVIWSLAAGSAETPLRSYTAVGQVQWSCSAGCHSRTCACLPGA